MSESKHQEDHLSDYLSGRLSETEAAAFEERLFADEGLAEELDRELELRAALAGQPIEIPIGPLRRRALPGWALAAAVLLITIGFVATRSVDLGAPEPVFRGSAQALDVELSLENGTLRLAWVDLASAASYEVLFFDAAGQLLLATETDHNDLLMAYPEDTATIEVSALDQYGQTVMASGHVPLRDRGHGR